MAISIDPTPPQTDCRGVVRPAIEAVVKLLGQNYVAAAFKAHDALEALRHKDETPEQRAWTLWRESVSRALVIFFDTAALTRKPEDGEEFERLLTSVLEKSAKIAEEEKVELTRGHLLRPGQFPLYRAFREKLPDLARLVAPDHRRDDLALQRRLDRAFERGFFDARVHGAEHFKPLDEALFGIGSEAMARRDEWQRYYEGLRRKVEDQPLFALGEDGPSLRDMFVPLRCYGRARRSSDHDPADRLPVTAHVVAMLNQTLTAWLDERDQNDLLRVVSGAPGSGKSSSARILALEVARKDVFDVYLLELQRLDITGEIDAIVADYVQQDRAGGLGLSASPIDWLAEADKPLLLIFDGLDEAAPPDGDGVKAAAAFIDRLKQRLRAANRSPTEPRLKALVLGRPQAAEQAGLPERALLHVAPLGPLDETIFKRPGDADLRIEDPEKLAAIDQREAFREKWAAAMPGDGGISDAIFSAEAIADLTVEPLLLHLLIVSGLAGERWREAADNRNRIYQEIFRRVHARDVGDKDHPVKKDLIEADFFTLMECLGLAAWRGGGRSGDCAEFDKLRAQLSPRLGTVTGADLANVALQIHTQPSGDRASGYAFVHKSFGDYLTARALITAGERWRTDHEGRPEKFAEAWLKLAGPQPITIDILRFMVDEARFRVNPAADAPVDLAKARKAANDLCAIAGWVCAHGLPAHDQDLGDGLTWRQRERVQANAEQALHALIHAWAEVGFPLDRLHAPEGDGGWRPGPLAIDWGPPGVAALVRRLDGVGPDRLFLSRLDLRGAILFGADLGGADLSGVYLSGAYLSRADLRGADLSGADLSGVYLSGAYLHMANLREAGLHGARLSGANLSGADLSRANLHEARLSRAYLHGADLSGARLSGAKLHGAQLHFADCSAAIDLCQDQIAMADGDAATRLPPGITRPAHWSDQGGVSENPPSAAAGR